MTDSDPISGAPDRGAAEVLNPRGRAPVCLVCEHASAWIPPDLRDLGLARADRLSHAVWDPGAEELTRALSQRLDASAVLARYSRLVHDCNRPAGSAEAVPERTERIAVPGNAGLTEAGRMARAELAYVPFHRAVAATLDRFATPPALVTVHSFTPTWFGAPRAVELGLLHDADSGLAERMLAVADPDVRTALNEPYSARDGVTHTLARHAGLRGIESVMIEVRNDRLADAAGVGRMADLLAGMLAAALSERALRP